MNAAETDERVTPGGGLHARVSTFATLARLLPLPLLALVLVLASSGEPRAEDLAMVLLAATAVLQAVRVWRRGEPLDPAGWFPLLYVLVFGGVVPFVRLLGMPPWYEGSRILSNSLGSYVSVVTLGYCGLLLGFAAVSPRTPKAGVISVRTDPGREWAALLLIGIGTFAMAFWARGALSAGGVYGERQFDYDSAYYLRQVSQALFFPALAVFFAHNRFAPSSWARLRRGMVFIFLAIFVVSTALMGNRSDVLYAAILVTIPYFLGSKTRANLLRNLSLLGAALTALALFGLWGYWRASGSLSGADWIRVANPFWIVISQSASVGGVVAMIMELVPSEAPHLWGASFISAIQNLLPGPLFPDGRPFIVPSLRFHALYRPDVTGHGFGFSILAEAYWNFGRWGGVVVMGALAAFLGASFRWAARYGSGFPVAWFAVIAFQSVWFLRSDSVVFVKGLVWCAAVFLAIEALGSILRDRRSPPTIERV